MTLGTWIGIFIVGILAAKFAPKVTWKIIFRPFKKQVKSVAQEWKES